MFSGAISICRGLQLAGAGAVDNFLITRSGLPVLVECKLWRNPEARREVVGQILDYAKVLSLWSVSDLEREVRSRTRRGLFEIVNSRFDPMDEVAFSDAVNHNLRTGRFLLIILGDGIREGVEALVDFMQRHAGLQFVFSLVEFPIFELPGGGQILTPRVLAKTMLMTRHVVEVSAGQTVSDNQTSEDDGKAVDADQAAMGDAQRAFWQEFLSNFLNLDDPDQPIPAPPRLGYVSLTFPAPSGSSWLNVYRDMKKGELGVVLTSHRNTPGEAAQCAIAEDWDEIAPLLGGDANIGRDRYGRPQIRDHRVFGDLDDPEVRVEGFKWLAERTNTFVNVLRPRVREVAYAQDGE